MKTKRTTVVLTLIEIAIGVASAGLQPAVAQGVLTAKPLYSGLCAIAACPQPPKPVVKALDSASVVSPGGKLVLQGVNFNSSDGNPGQIVLKIGSKFSMRLIRLGDNGYRPPYVERQLTVLGWADGHAFGQIPTDISGVMDGTATLEVWRSDGSGSNALPVQFKAAIDMKLLPMVDVAVQSCSNQADANLCNNSSDSAQLSIPPNLKPAPTLFAVHDKFLYQQNHRDYGSDVFTFTLNNGWTWDRAFSMLWLIPGCPNDPSNMEPGLDTTGSTATTAKLTVKWSSVCDDEYSGTVLMQGPIGVPWK